MSELKRYYWDINLREYTDRDGNECTYPAVVSDAAVARVTELEAERDALAAELAARTETALSLTKQFDGLRARIAALEALLTSIRSYMWPGNVMPVPEQAKYIVRWINEALTPSTSETEVKQ